MRFMLAMILVAALVSSSYGQSFVVTDRVKAQFVVDSTPVAFVVTDRQSVPVSPITAPPVPKAEQKPEVTLYSATWCGPCQSAKADLDKSKLPFTIKVVDVTNGGQPSYVDSIPYFEWATPNGQRFAKWSSVADLVSRWELSQKPVPKATTQPVTLTPQQQSMYDAAIRRGYSHAQIMQYAISHGLIKSK